MAYLNGETWDARVWSANAPDPNAPAPDAPDFPEPEHGAVRLSLITHSSSPGWHRLRLGLDGGVTCVLARGLPAPRLHIEGDAAHGLRLYCTDQGGWAPTIARHTGSWSVALAARRLHMREQACPPQPVDYRWEMHRTGPSIVIPRLPDVFLPEGVIAILPNSQVDQQTRFARADARLSREQQIAISRPFVELGLGRPVSDAEAQELADAFGPVPPEPSPATPCPAALPTGEGERGQGAGSEVDYHTTDAAGATALVEIKAPGPRPEPEPGSDASELRAAVALVNELKDRLGDEVVFVIDAAGRLQARRRVVSYVEV